MEAKIDPLTDEEKAYLDRQLGAATQFIRNFAPADADKSVTPEILDRAYTNWYSQNPEDKDEINRVINICGALIGEFFIRTVDIGFKWVNATDQYGSDLAIFALPGQGDILIYPTNLVAKRYERGETGFMAQLVAVMSEDIKARAKPAKTGFFSRLKRG